MSTSAKMRVESVPDVKFCLVFQCESLSVPVMRRVLGDTLRGLGVDAESVYDILLAATEACTNVLNHGGHQVHSYEVVTSLGAVGCQVEVADDGVGVAAEPHGPADAAGPAAPAGPADAGGPAAPTGPADAGGLAAPAGPQPEAPGSAPEIPIAQLPESGRGLAVMRAFVDDVTLHSRPGRGTVVIMSKHISWPADAPLRQFEAAS